MFDLLGWVINIGPGYNPILIESRSIVASPIKQGWTEVTEESC